MRKIKEKEYKFLKYKEDDIISLIELVAKKYSVDRSESKSFQIRIVCKNNEEIILEEPDSPKWSDLKHCLSRKKIDELHFSFRNYRSDKDFSINIVAGSVDYKAGMHVSVESNDDDEVNSTLVKIEELVDAVEPQKHLIRYKWPLLVIGVLIYIYLFYLTYLLAIYSQLSEVEAVIIILRILVVAFTFWLVNTISDCIKNTYPIIEFCFGPEHLQIAKHQRNKLRFICVMFIVPIVIQIILALAF